MPRFQVESLAVMVLQLGWPVAFGSRYQLPFMPVPTFLARLGLGARFLPLTSSVWNTFASPVFCGSLCPLARSRCDHLSAAARGAWCSPIAHWAGTDLLFEAPWFLMALVVVRSVFCAAPD